jgi:signal transduction histidine kinase
MRLRTKLVLTATGVTFAIVLVLSVLFLGELLRQRIEQTWATNDLQAHEVWLTTRQAVVAGLQAHPPPAVTPEGSDSDAQLHAAVLDALRSSDELSRAMSGIVRYSLTVQDVGVTDATGLTMVSTDPDALNQRAAYRTSFTQVRDGSLFYQITELFGKPRVLDIAVPLDRNGMPFLVVHVGVRSTFLRNSYAPWLRDALWFALAATLASMLAAALFSTVALRPLVRIGDELERLTLGRGEPLAEPPPRRLEAPRRQQVDPIGRVNRSLDLLGREMRSREEGYTALQANMAQMLDTLRDGVLLISAERRAVMVSDAVAHFLARANPAGDPSPDPSAAPPAVEALVGMRLDEIFLPHTALGAALAEAFEQDTHGLVQAVTLEDGRQVQISLDRIGDAAFDQAGGSDAHEMGTLLTLRDTGSALELEQELEVSRRLAAIGRLTANVGHEVKNPINAMVVHLELLRGKLAAASVDRSGAQKHVDILADEMQRLDRVVETLADFSRPMDLDLREHDLRRVIQQVLDLCVAELTSHAVTVQYQAPALPVPVRIDAELMRQALLNLLLNAMQAMPSGGSVRLSLRRDQRNAVVEIADNGEGIPAALLPRIFDLYFTTKPRGSGIGLAMTYRIVQLHGGAMEVSSNPDPASPLHGTTFTLQIPISVAPANEARRNPPRLPAAAETVAASGPVGATAAAAPAIPAGAATIGTAIPVSKGND